MLDDKDIAILEMLESDARIPWRRLARELGVSEATVYLRVKKLMENGVLRGFSARIDPARLGLSAIVFALVRAEAKSVPRVRSALSRLRYVAEAYEVSGNYHFLVKITAPDLSEASKVIDELMALEGVVEVSTFTVLRVARTQESVIRDYVEWVRE